MKKSMDELCEMAHKKVKEECGRLNIPMDKVDDNGDVCYADKAQNIFNKILDELDFKYNN